MKLRHQLFSTMQLSINKATSYQQSLLSPRPHVSAKAPYLILYLLLPLFRTSCLLLVPPTCSSFLSN
ncbi:hypothetical protein XELAEV_18030029mg [Xenopus laevis]|uniref:Uncharacterized protein n=1 Tax=Xenopus laevis TaxID=8355 RepID=A0A974CST8_XENLA|nr:hypothetical protein XELAEV_18030029mg [Xenopus laevis]